MNFLFDEHVAPRLVRALAELAQGEPYTVVHLRERFPERTKDVEWIGTLTAEGGWVFVSQDCRGDEAADLIFISSDDRC